MRTTIFAAPLLLAPLFACSANSSHEDVADDSLAGSSTPTPALALTNIMPLGDSMTLGIKAIGRQADGDWIFEARDGYRWDLWARLYRDAKISPNFVGSCPRAEWDGFKCTRGKGTLGDYEHEGHSGFKTYQLSAFIEEWMAEHRPKIVLLMVGTNDLCQDCTDWQQAPTRLSQLVDRVRGKLPANGHVFVASVPKRRDAGAARINWYNEQIPGIVNGKNDPRIVFVPQHIVGDEAKDLSIDNVHPSDCGYEKIAFVWYYYMNRTLANGTWPLAPSPFENHGACADK